MDLNNSAGAGGFWFSLSLVNAGLAQGKGRSAFAWWLWSLLLGPIATFLIVVWKPVPKPARVGAETRGVNTHA